MNETTTRWQAASPKRAWPAAIARNVSVTSARLTPGPTAVVPGRSGLEGGEGGPMDVAVLADLERGEVEPERGQLPAQVRDLAPCDPTETVVDERGLDLGELHVEGGGIRVVAGRGPASSMSAARVRRRRSAMKPKRWRYGSSGKRRRSCRSVSGRSSASRARRVARARGRRSPAVAAAIVCMSRRATASYPCRTWSAWMRNVRSVMSAVTNGLPSRSPPTHDPKRRKAGTRGGRVPVRRSPATAVEGGVAPSGRAAARA